MIPIFRRYLAELRPGPVDCDLVWKYLRLKCPEDLAIIAAPMAPRAEHLDPEQLVKTALALLEAADCLFLEQQRHLLEQMNSNTLFELDRVLNGEFNHDLTAYEEPERLYDPIASSLVRHLRDIRESMPNKILVQEDERIAKILRLVGDPIPLPCRLDEALRYATSEKKTPLGALELGFTDFLGLMLIDDAIDRESYTGLRVSTIEQGSSQQSSEERTQPDGTSANHDAKASPTKPSALSPREVRLTELRALSAGFIPAWAAPDYVELRARVRFSELQNTGITKKGELAWLVEKFRVFWRLHKVAYEIHVKEAEKLRLQENKNKVKGADAKNAKYQAIKLRILTGSFCTYLKEESIYPENLEELNLYFNGFKERSLMPEKTSESNALRFLSSLWSAVNTPNQSSGIFENLIGSKGFKTIGLDLAEECMHTLAHQKDHRGERTDVH